jgi:hypothetical protein
MADDILVACRQHTNGEDGRYPFCWVLPDGSHVNISDAAELPVTEHPYYKHYRHTDPASCVDEPS